MSGVRGKYSTLSFQITQISNNNGPEPEPEPEQQLEPEWNEKSANTTKNISQSICSLYFKQSNNQTTKESNN